MLKTIIIKIYSSKISLILRWNNNQAGENMIIRKDNGKKLLELNEKEPIIYGFLKDKHIDRKDILSASIFNGSMLTILYKGNYNFCKNISNMKFSEREGLNAILNELNKEELIFFPNSSYSIDPLINMIILSPMLISFIFNNDYIVTKIIVIVGCILLLILYFIPDLRKRKRWVYSIKSKEFQLRDRNNSILSNININEIEEVKRDSFSQAFCFKKGRTKIKMPVYELMDYPIKYKQILKEITSI